jgi:hypothetical protein
MTDVLCMTHIRQESCCREQSERGDDRARLRQRPGKRHVLLIKALPSRVLLLHWSWRMRWLFRRMKRCAAECCASA